MRPRKPIAEGTIDLANHVPTTSVYRAYDADGDLLYVGVTDNLANRLKSHEHHSRWYPLAATIEWESFDSRDYALEVERGLIYSLDPPHNTRHRVQRDWLPWGEKERMAFARSISIVDNL